MSMRLAVVAAAVIIGATGCGYSPNPDDTKACDVELFAPHLSYELKPLLTIVAAAVAVCDVTPVTHVINIGIEREDHSGGWSALLAGGNAWEQCVGLPRPGRPVECQRFVPCEDGRYRTVATVTGESRTGPFAFHPPERPASSLISCAAHAWGYPR